MEGGLTGVLQQQTIQLLLARFARPSPAIFFLFIGLLYFITIPASCEMMELDSSDASQIGKHCHCSPIAPCPAPTGHPRYLGHPHPKPPIQHHPRTLYQLFNTLFTDGWMQEAFLGWDEME